MKINKDIIKLLTFSMLFLFAFACSNEEGTTKIVKMSKPATDPVSIVTQNSYIPIAVNESYSLNAYVIPKEKSKEPLVYKIEDSSIATVDNKGKITTRSKGITKLTVSLKNNKKIYKNILINAYNPEDLVKSESVRSVYTNKTFLSLSPNKEKAYQIEAGIRPISKEKTLVYKSTDEDIINIDNNGFLTSKNSGDAAVIVFSEANPLKYAHVAVSVSNTLNGGNGEGSFQAPEGVSPIDLNADPFSLIAKYTILEYSINGNDSKKADKLSNLRVNVDLSLLGENIVKILMYVNLNGKEVKLIQQKDLSKYGSIPDIFTSLGAAITGKYTMTFTLDPVNYTEFSKQGLINKGETLILNIGKMENYAPAGGLGSDISFDANSVPVEQGGGSSDGSGENDTEIKVREIIFDKQEYTPSDINEKFTINANIIPLNAENKTLIWKSSDDKIAKVNNNGEVTILKNGNADITAESSNGVKSVFKIKKAVVPTDFMLEVDKQDLVLGIIDTFQINLILYPYFLENVEVPVSYRVKDSSIATVSESGLIKALAEGETIIYVTVAGIERQFYINVLPKSAGNIPVQEVILTSENGTYELAAGSFKLETQVKPANAIDKRLKYTVEKPEICEVNALGLVKLKANGETTIKVSAYNNENIYKIYKLKVQTLPTKAAFEKFDTGVAIGSEITVPLILEGSPSETNVKYTSTQESIADIKDNGVVHGHRLGKTTIKGETVNGLTSEYEIHVYTPVNKDDINTLKGTYDIVDFEQANGKLDVGTSNHGGVERMIGEMTIDVQGNDVIIKSKIQMDSSKMNNFGGVLGQGVTEARQGQFQYVEYNKAQYNKDGFGTPGKTSAKVTFDNDKIKLYQEWSEMNIVTVHVTTWIKKKSNDIKELDKTRFYWTKNGINGDKTANAVAHHSSVKPPEKEPYYTHGLRVK